jgi:hypothetical protein
MPASVPSARHFSFSEQSEIHPERCTVAVLTRLRHRRYKDLGQNKAVAVL